MNFLRRLPPLFFIGLFPVVMLLWAWADSRSAVTAWTYSRGLEFRFTATLMQSMLSFTTTKWRPDPANRIKVTASVTGPMGEFSREPMPRWAKPALFPRAESDGTWSMPNGFYGRTRQLPLWQLLVVYVPLWLGLSLWLGLRRTIKHEAEESRIKLL